MEATLDDGKKQRIGQDGIATEMLEAVNEFGINDMAEIVNKTYST